MGATMNGVVTNVTQFGAFVDIGVHQDGLVHISQLADKFVDDPSKIVSVGQKVSVKVIDVDINRKRISLSMKNQNTPKKQKVQPKKESGSFNDQLNALKGKWSK